MKYIKDGKYPEAEVGKYVCAVREVKSIEGRKYFRIQLSVAHDLTWNKWYTTLRGLWMKKGKKHLKLCNSYCVDPIWFGKLGRSTWQMVLTNDLCEDHKRHSGISLGMSYKKCADGR